MKTANVALNERIAKNIDSNLDVAVEETLTKLERDIGLQQNSHIVYDDGKFKIIGLFGDNLGVGVKRIMQADIKDFITNDAWKIIKKHIVKTRNFRKTIAPIDLAGIYKPDGQQLRHYGQRLNFKYNCDTGRCETEVPYPRVRKETYENLWKLLELVFEDDLMLFIKFLAQYTFEDRRGYSRSTLLLYGARGTGKNLIVENLMESIFPSLTIAIPTNYKDFTKYRTNRLIIIDENEVDIKQYEMAKLAKEISGSNFITVNAKFVPTYRIENQAYVVVMANTDPVAIKEAPPSDKDNQWVAIKMNTPLNEKEDFMDLLELHPDLSQMIKEEIGFFIQEYLHDYYVDNMKDNHEGRYGFRIPINDAVQSLCEATNMISNEESLEILEKIFNYDMCGYTNHEMQDKLARSYKLFHEQHFLPSSIIRDLSSNSKLKPKWVFDYIKGIGALDSKMSEIIKVNGKVYRGYRINYNKLEGIIAIETANVNDTGIGIIESDDEDLC